jgi:hypothetical protein
MKRSKTVRNVGRSGTIMKVERSGTLDGLKRLQNLFHVSKTKESGLSTQIKKFVNNPIGLQSTALLKFNTEVCNRHGHMTD